MFKTVVVIALLLVVKVLANPLHSRLAHEEKRVIRQEAECALQGGMCRKINDCDSSDIVRLAELCPQQSNLGVVCCYYF